MQASDCRTFFSFSRRLNTHGITSREVPESWAIFRWRKNEQAAVEALENQLLECVGQLGIARALEIIEKRVQPKCPLFQFPWRKLSRIARKTQRR